MHINEYLYSTCDLKIFMYMVKDDRPLAVLGVFSLDKCLYSHYYYLDKNKVCDSSIVTKSIQNQV